MKSILVITEAFTVGGLETHIAGEVAFLSQSGYEVHLAVGKQFKRLLLPTQLASLTTGLAFGPEASVSDLISTVDKLRQLIRLNSITLIHAHPFTSLLPGMLAAELENIPFVLTLHGSGSLASCYGPMYDFILKSIILPNAGVIIAVSEDLAQLTSPYVSQENMLVLPNGIAIDAEENDSEGCDARWLVVSRLNAARCAGVNDFVNKAKLAGLSGVVIAGDGPAKEELREKFERDGHADFVEFLGFRADIKQLMQNAAGVAGMGRVVLEAVANKKPVFLIGLDGVKGLVDEALFLEAASCNFSGKGLGTVSTEKFIRQVEQSKNFDFEPTYNLVKNGFSEKDVWKIFIHRIEQLPPQSSTLLGDVYRMIKAYGKNNQSPFLKSTTFFQYLGTLSHSLKYADSKLSSSFDYYYRQYVDAQAAGHIRVYGRVKNKVICSFRRLLFLDKNKVVKVVRKLYHLIPLPYAFKQYLRDIVGKYIARLAVPVQGSENIFSLLPTISIARKNPLLPDIIIFSVIDWDFRIQRPQQIAKIFAEKGHRVFYVANHFNYLAKPRFEITPISNDLPIYRVQLALTGMSSIYRDVPSSQSLLQLRKGLAALLVWADIGPLYTFVQHPFWTSLATKIPNSKLIYDCMDDHAGFGNTGNVIAEEPHLISASHLVLASSKNLYNRILPQNQHTVLIRNAADYAFFSQQPATRYSGRGYAKVIGYYGAIADWFDWQLIEEVSSSFPDCEVLLIGDDSVGVGKKLAHCRNVTFTGEVPYQQLPYYLYAFDVCIIPFKITPLTLDTNPVKAYEYLSAGKPVVAVDLPELHAFANLVQIAKTPEDFVQKIKLQLEVNSPQEVEKRQVFAASQTWLSRVDDIQEQLEKLPEPLVSIVVLTYNNLHLTKACLDSIEKHTQYKNIEIIIVDNASTDGTPEFLTEYSQDRDNYKVILNSKNLGYAAGNNIGLKHARGEYLVLLNNDTYVTLGWVQTMVNHFQCRPKLGLLGPITNNIGNAAKVPTRYRNFADMLPEAARIVYSNMGELMSLRTNTIAFFCVMLPRKVLEQVGLLDEKFGLGFFEDDDYCRRVEQLGFEIRCAKDVFVHHHLSASFNRLPSKTRQELFNKNKALYEAKWGKWVAHE
jgi:GT2 family glycosyltransferase/glycosyltransferase involved in cell wall biosynthesis